MHRRRVVSSHGAVRSLQARGPQSAIDALNPSMCRAGNDLIPYDINVRRKVLVGFTSRGPGFDASGDTPQDMRYDDSPSQSGAITSDPVFKRSDVELRENLKTLLTDLSIGDMQDVALEMHERFCQGIGGVYRSNVLDHEIHTFYDHFGLDWVDVVKLGNQQLPMNAGDNFKAWYILQHYRKAKPFITEITLKVGLIDDAF
jgi:hypothetical protein